MTNGNDEQAGGVKDIQLNAEDDIYNTLKIALAAGAGYLTGDPTVIVAATLTSIFTPPIQKRRDKLLLELAKGFVVLKQKVEGFSIVGLTQNELFLTALTQSAQAAMRAHQQQKLEALRNAVLNVALPGAPEDNIALMFIGLVDALTPWHLQFLTVFSTDYLSDSQGLWICGDDPGCIGDTVPELKGRPELRDMIISDLTARGLIYASGPDGEIDTSGHYPFRAGVTELGNQFLKFITSPINGGGK